jgi:hypothetical protein
MPLKNCSTDALADKSVSGSMVPYRVFVAGLSILRSIRL